MRLVEIVLGASCEDCGKRVRGRLDLILEPSFPVAGRRLCPSCRDKFYESKWNSLVAVGDVDDLVQAAVRTSELERTIADDAMARLNRAKLLPIFRGMVHELGTEEFVTTVLSRVGQTGNAKITSAAIAVSLEAVPEIGETVNTALRELPQILLEAKDPGSLVDLVAAADDLADDELREATLTAFRELTDFYAEEKDANALGALWTKLREIRDFRLRRPVGGALFHVLNEREDDVTTASLFGLMQLACESAHPDLAMKIESRLSEREDAATLEFLLKVLRMASESDCSDLISRITYRLVAIKDPATNDVLLQLTGDPNRRVRYSAAGALRSRKYKPANADERVAMVLARSHQSLFEDEMKSLGDCPGDALLRYLETCAHSSPPPALARALAELDERRAIEPLLNSIGAGSDLEFRQAAVRALAKLGGTEVIPSLLQLLSSEPQIRGAALAALEELEIYDAIPILMEALNDKEKWYMFPHREQDAESIRCVAARALGRRKVADAVPALIEALGDEEDAFRRSAAAALGDIGDVAAVHPLLDVLNDAQENVASIVSESLGRLKAKEAVPSLATFLEDSDWWDLRRSAAISLGQIADPAAIPCLLAALADDHLAVQQAAADALRHMESDAVLEQALPMLNNTSSTARSAIVEQLFPKLSGVRSVESLVCVLDDPDVNMRKLAARSLGCMRAAAGVAGLISRSLEDDDAGVRRESFKALGNIGDARAEGALIGGLEDAEVTVRMAAARSLGRIGTASAIRPLVKATADDKREMRWAVLAALGDLRSTEAMETLLMQIEGDDFLIQAQAVQSLTVIEPPAVDRLLPLLDKVSGFARWCSNNSLSAITDDAAKSQLQNALDAAKVRDRFDLGRYKDGLAEVMRPTRGPFGEKIFDFRSTDEIALQQRAGRPLEQEDEQIVEELLALQPLVSWPLRGNAENWALNRVRDLGQFLYDSGGNWRMVLAAYRFKSLSGSSRELEIEWDRIGDWHA